MVTGASASNGNVAEMQSEERGDQEQLRRESERSERAAVVSEANGVAWARSDGREADDCIVAVGKRKAGEPKLPCGYRSPDRDWMQAPNELRFAAIVIAAAAALVHAYVMQLHVDKLCPLLHALHVLPSVLLVGEELGLVGVAERDSVLLVPIDGNDVGHGCLLNQG